MSFNHLSDDIEALLFICDKYSRPFSAEKISTLLTFESKENISWLHVAKIMNSALEMELINRYNPCFEEFNDNSISYSNLFILSSKGKEYIKNLKFEKERLHREKETLQIAKEASRKANVSNIIAIISIIFSLFSFFYNNYITKIQDTKATINENIEINKLKLDK